MNGDKTLFVIGQIWVHRREQYDLDCWPIICIHRNRPDQCTRLFCLWFWGIMFRIGHKPIVKRFRFLR